MSMSEQSVSVAGYVFEGGTTQNALNLRGVDLKGAGLGAIGIASPEQWSVGSPLCGALAPGRPPMRACDVAVLPLDTCGSTGNGERQGHYLTSRLPTSTQAPTIHQTVSKVKPEKAETI